jgi:hypothetical protein
MRDLVTVIWLLVQKSVFPELLTSYLTVMATVSPVALDRLSQSELPGVSPKHQGTDQYPQTTQDCILLLGPQRPTVSSARDSRPGPQLPGSPSGHGVLHRSLQLPLCVLPAP